MQWLEFVLFNNPLHAWLQALGVACGCLLILMVFQRILLNRLARFAAKTETQLDDLLLEVSKSTRIFTLVMISVYMAEKILATTPEADRYLRLVIILVALFQSALWVSAAIAFLLKLTIARRKEEDAGSVTALTAMGLMAKFILWALFALLALSELGVNVTGLVAGLGVGGIALALAVQNVLGDLLASLAIVLDRPFAVGDVIAVDTCMGTVEHIGLKSTRVRSISGEQIIFSNSDLLKSRIRNHKRMSERRVVFTLGVGLQTSHAQLSRMPAILRGILEAQPGLRFDRAHFKEISHSALLFEMVYFMDDIDFNLYMETQQAINLELIRALETEQIALAYPLQPAPNQPS